MIDFAYSRLGLRFNPFGELDRQQRIENAVPRCDLESLQEFLDDPTPPQRRAVQFIGRAGSGKSTHMLMLAMRLQGFHYVHLPLDSKRHVPSCKKLMIDEAQRLGWRRRNRLFRNADQIVLGTHQCFARPLQALGFDLKTVSLDQLPTVDWLVEALNRKVDSARRQSAAADALTVTREFVVSLLEEFGNNIRGMERHLYDAFQALNCGNQKTCRQPDQENSAGKNAWPGSELQ